MEGVLVWFSAEKKMGLIRDPQGKVHVVHQDQIPKPSANLKVGEKIKFQLGNFPGFVEIIKGTK